MDERTYHPKCFDFEAMARKGQEKLEANQRRWERQIEAMKKEKQDQVDASWRLLYEGADKFIPDCLKPYMVVADHKEAPAKYDNPIEFYIPEFAPLYMKFTAYIVEGNVKVFYNNRFYSKEAEQLCERNEETGLQQPGFAWADSLHSEDINVTLAYAKSEYEKFVEYDAEYVAVKVALKESEE